MTASSSIPSRARDANAVRVVTTRNNQRLFRTAWSILKHRAEAEDALQSAYLKAFAAIESFEGRSSLSTWLTRIVINEALGRQRSAKRRRTQLDDSSVTVLDDYREKLMRGSMSGTSPETELAHRPPDLEAQEVAVERAGGRATRRALRDARQRHAPLEHDLHRA